MAITRRATHVRRVVSCGDTTQSEPAVTRERDESYLVARGLVTSLPTGYTVLLRYYCNTLTL